MILGRAVKTLVNKTTKLRQSQRYCLQSNCISRRLEHENRIVYVQIEILSCDGHYEE